MNKARMNQIAQMSQNGHAQKRKPKPVRIVPNLRLEISEGHVIMMLGEDAPEMGVALAPDNVRGLIEALDEHLRQIEGRRIVLPGE